MTTTVFVRLDEAVRRILELEARAQGRPLASLMCDLAAEAAAGFRRTRIRKESEAVGRFIADHEDAALLIEGLGRPPLG
jgi:hypothetical protein